jgi:hypothetical protein
MIFITRPPPIHEAGKTEPAPKTDIFQEDTGARGKEPSGESERRAIMQVEFEKLSKARRDLEQRLNKLKVVLWGLKLPKEENDAITETMKNSYAMLKNPKLLGAYSGPEELAAELSRIEYLKSQLQEINEKYRTSETR